jgi:hypothetical protein
MPDGNGPPYFKARSFPFTWNPGFAPIQKRKNVAALHASAAASGLGELLEVSSKSEQEIGRRLSAFSLKVVTAGGEEVPLENVFQSSKVYERGGPYLDLLGVEPKAAKRDPRHQGSGRLVEFRYNDLSWPLVPRTAFYDWLYIKALFPHREYLRRLDKYQGFTDIEFNPNRSINCQAKSLATLVGMQRGGVLEAVMADQATFLAAVKTAKGTTSLFD